ncbi:MAG: hypothetical protein QF903_13180 [Planctomycetota bacterium]|jgi:hypothetical protein|nr:hypothetical protein [Planctomycetota bacterium]MDP6764258.1 hypothetical protein [Planctomycetota bacterium]MDP6990416.1 hypothetical protein [Planctomycetota bacterium]
MPNAPAPAPAGRTFAAVLATGLLLAAPACSPDPRHTPPPAAGAAQLAELGELLARTSDLGSEVADEERILLESLLLDILPATGQGDSSGHEWQVRFDTQFRYAELFWARTSDHVPQARIHLRYRSDLTEEQRAGWGEEELLYRPASSGTGREERAPLSFPAIPAAKHYFVLVGAVELRASALTAEWANPARLKVLLRTFPLEEIARF